MNVTKFDEDGAIRYSRTYDTSNGTVTITEGGVSRTEPAAPTIIASILAENEALNRRQRLDNAAATLREWAADAAKVDVAPMTVNQHKAVTQTVVTRLGVFFDRFADLLDER